MKGRVSPEETVIVAAEKQVRMVEDVEELGQKFDPRLLGKPEDTGDPQVVIMIVEPAESLRANYCG